MIGCAAEAVRTYVRRAMAARGGFVSVSAAPGLWRQGARAAVGLSGRYPERGYAAGPAQVSRPMSGQPGGALSSPGSGRLFDRGSDRGPERDRPGAPLPVGE